MSRDNRIQNTLSADDELDALVEAIERERRDRFEAYHQRLVQDAEALRRMRRDFDERIERIYEESTQMFQMLKPSLSQRNIQSIDDIHSIVSSSESTEFESEEDVTPLKCSLDAVLSESHANKQARMALADLHRARTMMSIQSLFSHIHEVYGVDLSNSCDN